MVDTNINVEALVRYSDLCTLMPLHKWGDTHVSNSGETIEDGKRPLYKNWTTRPFKTAQTLKQAQAEDRNVGVRLRADQLIVDVDPRNMPEGRDTFKELCDDLNLDPTRFPRVITGGGGLHVYMTKGQNEPVVNELKDKYPGVEFKTIGRQVVAAGSKHPNGNMYRWEGDVELWEGERAPDSLMALVARPLRSEWVADGDFGIHDQNEIDEMLAELDPSDFADHDTWFQLMCSVHHASAGEAMDEFVAWSTSDPTYAGHGSEIEMRWNTLDQASSGSVVTYKSLHKALRDAGASDAIPQRKVESDEFDDAEEQDEEPKIESIKPKKTKRPHTFLWPHELMDLKPPEWLVKGFVPLGSIVGIVGPPRSFKSFVATYIAQCLAAGKNPWGLPPDRPTPTMVFTIAGEGGAGYNARIDAWNTEHLFKDCKSDGGMEERRALKSPHDKMDDLPMHLIRTVASNLVDHKAIEEIVGEINWVRNSHFPECRVIVIFDTFSANFIGDENSNQVAEALKTCKWIRDELRAPVLQDDGTLEDEDASVLIVHHTGKDQSKGSRGHSSFKGDVDVELLVWRPDEEGMEAVVWVDKMKDDEDQFGIKVILKRVDVKIRGENKSSLVVMDETEPQESKKSDKEGGNGHASKAYLKTWIEDYLDDHFADAADPVSVPELLNAMERQHLEEEQEHDEDLRMKPPSTATVRRYLKAVCGEGKYNEARAEKGNVRVIIKA